MQEMGAPATKDVGGQSGSSAAPHGADSKFDAGALFVLQSKGSWVHCGYHLTSSIVAPALLSLPLALAFLGWGPGLLCLTGAAVVTFYSYSLLSLVLEHHAQRGSRHLRFRDVAYHVLGPKWARYYVGPIQFLLCYGAVIGNILLGGQSLKTIYSIARPQGSVELYAFVAWFGALMLVLAQMPSFHSLRHLTLASLALSLAYSACATAGSVRLGRSSSTNYSLPSDGQDRVFGAFNGIAIIATTYGNGIIPEIQATIAPPVKGKMFKGLCLCYSVVICTFFSVAISGYWAFGNQAQGVVLSNLLIHNHSESALPHWFLLVAYACTLLQLSAVAVVYLQPTNEVLEGLLADPHKAQHSARNLLPRLLSRSLSIVLATTIAAMLPFFGDINAVLGAFGFLPLDFVIPALLYNVTFRPSRRSFLFWLNSAIVGVFSAFSVVGSISAIRQIALDADEYRLFANV